MTDLERFRQFFDMMGVFYTGGGDYPFEDSHVPESLYMITVAQCHFHFDKDKNFIGTLSDEMLVFTPVGETDK